MQEQMNEKKATVSIESLPSLLVSPLLMRPLFQILINNALEGTHLHTHPIIKIHSEIGFPAEAKKSKNLPNKKYCRIFIDDNGVGFDQKRAERIFNSVDRFPLNGESKGDGIGLTLCKKIVDQHQGFISATSKGSEGSTIIISLPMPG